MKFAKLVWIFTVGTLALGGSAAAEGGFQNCCRGRGMGRMDAEHERDSALFHYLLDHRSAIRRSVEEIPGGVQTLTESDDAEIAAELREHVRSMYARLEENRPIHRRDPLFAEIFRHAEAIEMVLEDTEHGIRVRETSSDPYVTKLIRAHAGVVSRFLENGRREMRKDHPVPER